MKPIRIARRGFRVVAAECELRLRGERGLATAVAHAYRARADGSEREWVDRIESMRSELEATDRLLDDGLTVGEVTRRGSKGRRAALMLLSMVRQVRPKSVIEMGTCVGISGSYLAAGLRINGGGGRLITLEGNPERCETAIATFDRLGLEVDARVGLFSDTFASALRDADPVDLLFIDGHHEEEPTVAYFGQALPHMAPGAVVVFDDIEWSDGMRRAWAAIGSWAEVALHVNAGGVGIVRLVARP